MYGSQYNSSQSSGYGPPPGGSQSPQIQMDETAAVAMLMNKSMTELNQILENDGKLDDMINELQQVKNIHVEREASLARNKSLADYNISLQPKFEQLKRQVATEYEQLNTLKTELAMGIAKIGVHTSQQSLDTLLAVLQTEAAKSDEETEDLAMEFCSKKIDVSDFLIQYIPKRTEAHTKRIRAEKMADIIRNPSACYPPNTPSVVIPYKAGGYSSVPYPTSNAMPMPSLSHGPGY